MRKLLAGIAAGLLFCLSVCAADHRDLMAQRSWYAVSLPANYDAKQKYEVVVGLHGAGDNPDNFLNVMRVFFGDRPCIIATPKPANAQGWALDEDDKISATITDLKRTYSVDEKKIALVGFSSGCAMGFSVVARNPELFRCYGGFAHVVIPQVTDAALKKAAAKTSIFYSVGTIDPMEKGYAPTVQRLKTAGFDVTSESPEGIGHSISPEHFKRLSAFLDGVYAKDAKAGEAKTAEKKTK